MAKYLVVFIPPEGRESRGSAGITGKVSSVPSVFFSFSNMALCRAVINLGFFILFNSSSTFEYQKDF